MNRRRLPSIGWWLLAIVPLLLLALIGPLVWDYYRIQRLSAIAQATNSNSYLVTEYRGPEWFRDTARECGFAKWVDLFETRVTSIRWRDPHLGDEHLHFLPNRSDVKELILEGAGVTDDGLESLGTLPSLEIIFLRGAGIGRGFSSLLRKSPRLEGLICSRCSIDPAAFSEFPISRNLEVVALKGMPITTENCKFLRNARSLRCLYLPMTQVDDQIISLLVGFPELTEVDFSHTLVSDRLLLDFRKLPILSSVKLAGTRTTDHGARSIANLEQLVYLGLSSTAITDAGTLEFDRLKNLQDINLADTAVSDETLRRVFRLPKLVSADFSGTGITDTGLDALTDDPIAKRKIWIADTAISDAAVHRACDRHPTWEISRERRLPSY